MVYSETELIFYQDFLLFQKIIESGVHNLFKDFR